MIYLASPYSHPDPVVRQWRFDAACQATAAMIRDGRPVFSPVVHSHPLTRYGLPVEWEFWERYDRAYMAACREFAILTLEGWKESKGVKAEIHIAAELRLPLYLIDPVKVGVRAERVSAGVTESDPALVAGSDGGAA